LSPPREGRWAAKPLRPRTDLYAALLIAVSLVAVAGLVSIVARDEPRRDPVWIAYGLGAAFLAAYLFVFLNELRIRRRTKEDAAWCERPEGLQEFAVEISVRSKGAFIGNDRGVVYFDGALLGFAGGRTSFLLSEGDIERPKGVVLFEWDRLYLPLGLNVEDEGAAVTIRPLLGQGLAYRRALRLFLRAREATDADRQWPPLVARGKDAPVEDKPPEPPRLPDAEAAELLERAELALRLGHMGEYQRLQDEALGTTRHNRA